MSIENANTIDAVGFDSDSADVILLISDHLAWGEDGDEQHMYQLQEKLNAYLRFYESGEIYKEIPEVEGKKVIIDIVGKYKLNKKGELFLAQIKPIIESAGLRLQFRMLDNVIKDITQQ